MRLPAFRRSIVAATLLASAASFTLFAAPASAQPKPPEVHREGAHPVRAAEHRRRHRVWRNHHWVYYYK